jgi:FdhD protein
MTGEIVPVGVVRITDSVREEVAVPVVVELPLTILLNGNELLTTLCSPADLENLAAGILFSEGIISKAPDILSIRVDPAAGLAHVETSPGRNPSHPVFKPLIASGGGKGPSGFQLKELAALRVQSSASLSAGHALGLMDAFLQRSAVYQATHGVHSAALCDESRILLFKEDIGRHNALDKVFGECLLKGISTEDRIVLTSGRISSEVLLKVAKRRVPFLISKAPPTNLGVRLAADLGLTLAVARSGTLTVYAHAERVANGE